MVVAPQAHHAPFVGLPKPANTTLYSHFDGHFHGDTARVSQKDARKVLGTSCTKRLASSTAGAW